MNLFNLPFSLMDQFYVNRKPFFIIILFLGISWFIFDTVWKNFFHNSNTNGSNKKYFIKSKRKGKPINQKILENYYREGLNDSDIDYFRQTMATALDNINQVETFAQKNPTLHKLNQKYRMNELLHTFFKAIVAKPQRIDTASDFLYKELPSLVVLYQKFNEIDNHIYQDKETQRVLELSQDSIKRAYEKINQEYHKFIAEDLETLHNAADNF